MTTVVRDDVELSRFEIVEDGTLAGFAEYVRDGQQMVFPHTEVFAEFGGRGLGSVLIGEALDRCRAESLVVVPLCSFVRAFIDKHPAYADLVATG